MTARDILLQKEIIHVILGRHPKHVVYAEESATRPGGANRVRILDPIDGTINFASGLPLYACL